MLRVTTNPMETDSPEELENNLCSLISYPSKQDYRIKYNLTSVLGTLFYTMHKKSSLGRWSLCLLVVYKLYQKLKTFFFKESMENIFESPQH